MKLFVYGTLKSGERNCFYFLNQQKLLGPARTKSGFRLFDLGEFPVMQEDPEGGSILGELWEVDERCLKELDRLEGVDKGLYERKWILLQEPEVEAQVYLGLFDMGGFLDCGESWQKSLWTDETTG